MSGRGRDHALEDAPLAVELDPDAGDVSLEAHTAAGAETEEFGVRVAWQSEDTKIEAAEFLVATRIQQDARIRAAQDLETLRHPDRA